MESRRGQKGDIYNGREVSRRRSLKKKPPRCNWQPTVPSWEKTFCKVVGSLDWEMILDMKKFVHLYDNVVEWNDSAGEEAFHNAKKQFLANIHGLPCDVSLPSPDLYIDEVDWDAEIDPELLLDLDREYLVPSVSEDHEAVVILGDTLTCNQAFSATGWGENDDDFKKATNSSSNNHDIQWDHSVCRSLEAREENGWGLSGHNMHLQDEGGGVGDTEWGESGCDMHLQDEGGGVVGDTGQGDGWENSWRLNNYDTHGRKSKTLKGTGDGGAQGTWDVSNRNNNNAGRFSPRYNPSRFRGNDNQGSRKQRNGSGHKRETSVHEHRNKDKKLTPRWWNAMNSCGPVSYHSSGETAQTWNVEKPIS